MSVRKLNLLSIALLLAAGTAGVSAANLETKSGRYFENYSISRQDGLTVTVLHMDGAAKVPLTDLPDDIARPYIQKAIEQRVAAAMRESDPEKRIRILENIIKQLPAANKIIGDQLAVERKQAVEQQVAVAMREKDPDKQAELLQKIVERYPTASEKVREMLANARQGKAVRAKIADAIRSGNPAESLRQLQNLREQYSDSPTALRRVDAELAEQQEKQRKQAEEIDLKMQKAAAERNTADGLRQLKELREKYPQYPFGERQQEYSEKMDRLIREREIQCEQEQKRRKAQADQLREIWRIEFTPDRTKWQEFFRPYYAVEQALGKAKEFCRQSQYDSAIPLLENVIEQEPAAVNLREAQDLLRQLQQERRVAAAIRRAEQTKSYEKSIPILKEIIRTEAQAANIGLAKEMLKKQENRLVIRKLEVNNSAQRAQLTIRKEINRGNQYFLYIFPADRKEEIRAIHQKMENTGSCFQQFEKHLSEKRKLEAEARAAETAGERAAKAQAWSGNTNESATLFSAFNKSSDLRSQARAEAEKARQAILLARQNHDEVKSWIMQEALQTTNDLSNLIINQIHIPLTSDSCTLSNIQGPIVLLAWEQIDFGYKFSSYQGWYMEYPSAEKEWILK